MVTKTLISGGFVVVIFKVGGRTEGGYKKLDWQKNVYYETSGY